MIRDAILIYTVYCAAVVMGGLIFWMLYVLLTDKQFPGDDF